MHNTSKIRLPKAVFDNKYIRYTQSKYTSLNCTWSDFCNCVIYTCFNVNKITKQVSPVSLLNTIFLTTIFHKKKTFLMKVHLWIFIFQRKATELFSTHVSQMCIKPEIVFQCFVHYRHRGNYSSGVGNLLKLSWF